MHAYRRSLMVALLAGLFGAAGCDDTFTPIAPTDLQYSIFGYLDASADTQWIRVMPIRPLVPTTSDSFDATVTLEHLGTGRTVDLRDSVFAYPLNAELGTDSMYLHNFWTTEEVVPGASYRLQVQRSGQEPAEAVLQIPRDYEVEVWVNPAGSVRDTLQLTGLKHPAFVTENTVYWDSCGAGSSRLAFPVKESATGVHHIAINRAAISTLPRCGRMVLERRDLWVVGSEAQWPVDDYSTWGLAIRDKPSNVSNAVGFLGGVLTKVIPYEACEFTGPSPLPMFCKLNYGASSATLRGAVKEVRCGKGPIDSVQVQLTELNPNPTHRKLRTTLTNRVGEFLFGALEPGIRYVLRIRVPTRPNPGSPPIELYAAPTDTVQFTTGQRAYREIGVAQLSECWMNPT